jgi:Ca-activated chloride channel family protein
VHELIFVASWLEPMPQFTNPLFLLFAFSVPLLLLWWLRRHRGALRYPHTGLFADLPPGRNRIARWGGAGMRACGLLLLILALAGPRWPDLRTRVSTEGIAIAMVVDVSGSMAELDFEWQKERISRLEAVKRVFGLFVAGGEGPDGEHLEGRPDDLMGLVTFATRPDSVCPMTLSHSVLMRLLNAEQPRSIPTESQTNIGDAILWGVHQLDTAGSRRKVMVLLSDGEHNVAPPAWKPRRAAQIAANLHVPIYAIDAGGDAAGAEPVPEGQTSPAEDRASGEKTLQAVAKITSGRYFRAHDAKSLLAVCQEIDQLERQEIQSFQYRRYYEGYPWFGLASLVFLVGVHLLEMTVWQRIP